MPIQQLLVTRLPVAPHLPRCRRAGRAGPCSGFLHSCIPDAATSRGRSRPISAGQRLATTRARYELFEFSRARGRAPPGAGTGDDDVLGRVGGVFQGPRCTPPTPGSRNRSQAAVPSRNNSAPVFPIDPGPGHHPRAIGRIEVVSIPSVKCCKCGHQALFFQGLVNGKGPAAEAMGCGGWGGVPLGNDRGAGSWCRRRIGPRLALAEGCAKRRWRAWLGGIKNLAQAAFVQASAIDPALEVKGQRGVAPAVLRPTALLFCPCKPHPGLCNHQWEDPVPRLLAPGRKAVIPIRTARVI